MGEKPEKLTKITIIDAVVFDKEIRAKGDVVDVPSELEGQAHALIKRGRAVAGAKKVIAPAANKSVDPNEKREGV